MDLGCGNGRLTAEINSEKIYSTDFSLSMLREFSKIKKRNVNLVQANISKLPYLNNYFDRAICFSTIYYSPNFEEVISEVNRCLSKKGLFIFDSANLFSLGGVFNKIRYNGLPQFFKTYSTTEKILQRNNFSIVKVRFFEIIPRINFIPEKILNKIIGKRMLDEVISSVPLLRRFAFRYLIVCKKSKL